MSAIIVSGLQLFGDAAVWLSVAPVLVGLAFMSGGKDALAGDFAELAQLKDQTCSPEVGGWLVHLIFFGGFACWSWAFSTLGLALGFEPALALAIGFSAFYGCFVYMAIAGQSLMGFPGFYGVPPPLRILFGIVNLSLIVNVVFKALDGAVPLSFYGVLLVGVGGPHLIGAKVRSSTDWKAPMPPSAAKTLI